MRKKTGIIVLAIAAITSSVFFSGCGNRPYQFQPEISPAVASENPLDESDLDGDWEAPSVTDGNEKDSAAEIGKITAGNFSLPAMQSKYHATDGENIYFREYQAEDFADPVYLYFSNPFMQDTESQFGHNLFCMKPNGNIELLTDFDPGFGPIYYAGGRLFSQGINIVNMDHYNKVYYVNLDEEYDYITMDDYTSVLGVVGDYIFCEKRYEPEKGLNGGNSIIDAVTLKEVATVEGFYLGADKNGMYSYESSNGTNMEMEDMFVNVYLTDYDGNTKLIGEIGPEDFARNETYYTDGIIDSGIFEVPCFQILDDCVVMNVGYYAGTGHFFSGGIICYVFKQGGSYYLCNNDFEGFVCAETQDAISVSVYRYDTDAEDYVTETYSIAGGIAEAKGYSGDVPGHAVFCPEDDPDKACLDCNGNAVSLKAGDVYMYNGFDGCARLLLEKEEYENFGYRLLPEEPFDDNGPQTMIYNVEYVGDKLFFTLSLMKREASEDIGWRYAYRHSLSTDYVKDLSTGEIHLLFNYGPDNS